MERASRDRKDRRTASRAAWSLLLALASLLGGLVDRGPRVAAAQDAGDPDVRELLSRAEDTYRQLGSLRARFSQTIDVPLLERSTSGSGVWYQKGPGRFKMEFTEPSGDLIVADGTHVWLFYPSTNPGQVIKSEIDANPTGAQMVDLQGRIFADARTEYDAAYVGIEEITGRPTHLVSLTPRDVSPYARVRVWVDTETLLVRKFEITQENETVRTVELSELEPNAAIADPIFHFEPPADADVFEG